MRQSLKLGTIGGVEVGVHWSVLVIAALLTYGLDASVLPAGAPGQSPGAYAAVALTVAVVFLACLLAHELSHTVIARHFGVGVRSITLWLLGGVSELEDEAPTPKAELFIAAAGPATSLALGGVAAGAAWGCVAAGAPRLIVVALAWLAGVNLILGVFNLLPGAPLDGGRVLRALLWWTRGDRTSAQIIADRAGMGLGLLLAIGGGADILFAGDLSGLWLVLLGWFLVSAASAETADVRLHAALADRLVRDVMSTEPVCGNSWQPVDVFVRDIVAHSRHRTFPVVDLDGRLAGMVNLAALGRLPEAERGELRLRDVATPAQRLVPVGPDEPIADAAKALSPGTTLVPVVDNGRLVGVFTINDVSRAIEVSALAAPLAASTAQTPPDTRSLVT